ncbi:hypothetical protein F5Y16DRAFT_173411 [Xylariaceae sp. FL0255]|nr:hypothetical protein F5Y16DRAFT_173411 [Xylariaceae sp. FL0255]
MAHHHHLLPPQQAIFSPSVARAAASTANDWAYVDAWLRAKYSPEKTRPPSFERNPETLDALLSLIAANEAADHERHRLALLDQAALDELNELPPNNNNNNINNIGMDLLHNIDAALTRDGRTALDAMADVAIALHMAPSPEPQLLARRFVELQARAIERDHAQQRLGILQSHVHAQSTRLPDEPPPSSHELHSQVDTLNNELHKSIETTTVALPELTQQVDMMLRKSVPAPYVTVQQVRAHEEAYQHLLATKKQLDAHVKAFAGLPPDVDAARAELDALRQQLRHATDTRDANFEMLVERESPVKTRTARR